MAENALSTFQRAEDLLRGGKYIEALQSYMQCVRAVPEFWRARFRIADTLLNVKAHHGALEIYKALAWHAIKAGFPLQGLVALKMAAAMDPSLADVIEVMAELYSKDSDRVIGVDRRRVAKHTDPVAPWPGQSGQELVAIAVKEAADTETMGSYPQKLPAIPLFSFLDEDAFVSVLEGLQLKRFVAGQKIIEEGRPGDSFFILAEGNVEVTRDVKGRPIPLARLHDGAVFGEMALISQAPRTATVTAMEDCDLLELSRESLVHQADKLASVTQALKIFTHDRFLANLTATSPIFKPFPRTIRTEIIKRFKDFPAEAGEEIIAEGEAGEGLFLILKGAIEVSKLDGRKKVSLAQLKEGDVFGEIALIADSPTTATCTAITEAELLFLPKRDFNSLMARHPELKNELSKLTADRIKKTKEMLAPEESEDYVLIEDDDLIML